MFADRLATLNPIGDYMTSSVVMLFVRDFMGPQEAGRGVSIMAIAACEASNFLL